MTERLHFVFDSKIQALEPFVGPRKEQNKRMGSGIKHFVCPSVPPGLIPP